MDNLSDSRPLATTRRPLGATGLRVSPIALDGSIFGWAAGHEATAEVLDAYWEAGGNYLTTADHYAGGRSEIMIGHWVNERSARDDVILATKIGRHPDAEGLSADSISLAVDACLERLRTDRIDVLVFDQDHPDAPIDETLSAVQKLVEQGKVRFIGESGFSAKRLLDFDEVSLTRALPSIDVIVAEYNLMVREPYERDLVPRSLERGGATVARLPLASGFLTGDYRNRGDLPQSVMFDDALNYVGRRGNRVLGALETVAAELEETLACVAVAWVLSRPGIATTALRSNIPEQLHQVLPAPLLTLSEEQVRVLDKASS